MMARHPKFHAPALGFGGLEKLFGELFESVALPSPKSMLTGRMSAPAVDVREEEAQFVVEAAVPGLTGEQLSIEFEDGVLTLSGEWSSATEAQREQSLRRELARGSFKRELRFHDRVDADGLSASLQDGILTVRLPKAAQTMRKQIAIDPGNATE